MDQSIEQLGQDLALAKYAKSTCKKYLRTAEHLAHRFGQPLAKLTREQLRTYVEEISALGKSASVVGVPDLRVVVSVSQDAGPAGGRLVSVVSASCPPASDGAEP